MTTSTNSHPSLSDLVELSVIINQSLADIITQLADYERRTIDNQIIWMLESYIRAYGHSEVEGNG